MAEKFDTTKAATDLKHILKMNPMSQDLEIDSKKNEKKNNKRTEYNQALEDGSNTQNSQHRKHSDRPKNTHRNSNGNALLDSNEAGWQESAESTQRSTAYLSLDQSDQKLKKRENNYNSTFNESKSTSSVLVIKKNPETPDNRNSKESAYTRRGNNNNFYNRNSSATTIQRRNNDSQYNRDEEASRFVRNRDPYKGDSRGEHNRSRMNEGRRQTERTSDMPNISANNSKEEPPEVEEELSSEVLLTFDQNSIKILKKRNQRFVKAKYYCELCDFHLNTKTDCDKHMKEYRHSRKKQLNDEELILKSIPEPSQQQFAALTAAVDKVYEELGINENERKQRADIVKRLEKVLKEHVPDVLMFMYGSSLTGFGLKTSDINVNLTSAVKDKKLTLLLKETYQSLKDLKDSGFSNLRSDFTTKIPGFFLVDDRTGLTIHVVIHCYNAHCTSEFLSIYADFDIRVRKLAVAFRYWAHVCDLDQKCDGFIPPQAFNLMVIYYLQDTNPQLVPIIQPPKVTGDEIGDFRNDAPGFEKMRSKVMKETMKSNNNMSVGELWFRLLKFYCLKFDTANVVVCIHSSQSVSRKVKPWNNKRLAVEDPYMLKRNMTRMVKNSRVYEYWEDSIRKALQYFGFPRDAEGKSQIAIEDMANNKGGVAQKPNSNINSENDSDCVSLENEQSSTSGVTPNVTSAKDAVAKCEDYAQNVNRVSKSSSHSESDVITDSDDGSDCFFNAEQEPSSSSSGVPDQPPSVFPTCSTLVSKQEIQLQQRNLSVSSSSNDSQNFELASSDQHINEVSRTPNQQKAVLCDCKNKRQKKSVKDGSTCAFCTRTAMESVSKDVGISDTQDSLSTLPSSNHADSAEDTRDNTTLSQSSLQSSSEEVNEINKNTVKLPKNANSLCSETNCHYEFSKDFLTDGKGPVLVCTYCEKEGHLKNACPDDKLPEVHHLPKLTPFHIKVLSETLNKVPAKVGLTPQDLNARMNFMNYLERFIQDQFKDANLALFGSSCNGFGFKDSDMDICLTFSLRKVIDKPWLVETIARRMKQCKELSNVQAIPTAKVPIVKFSVKNLNNLDGDISLYNTLAQHNTKLLRCYSQIDPRVKTLGYVIKTFAKVCDIGDASRGSLSSYAYILMMIYYLQQVVPPVIPVLQELYEGKEKPEQIIEGSNAWFMNDPNKLDKLWPMRGRNKMSLAELWLGFLCFYVEEFDCNKLVVTIRQKAPLTRFEKLWNGENIAIEDPFDLNHNLGSGLSKKMNNFIFKTFINGRMLYGSPVDDNMDMFKTYSDPHDYFFDKDLLSENRPPNVRGCRQCGKMGHLARNCPSARKDRDDSRGPQRQQKQIQQQSKQPPSQQIQQQRLPPSVQKEQQRQLSSGSSQERQPSQLQTQSYQGQPKQDSQSQQKLQFSQQQKTSVQPLDKQVSTPSPQSQNSNSSYQSNQPPPPQHQQLLPLLDQQSKVKPYQQQDQAQQQHKQEQSLPLKVEQRQVTPQEKSKLSLSKVEKSQPSQQPIDHMQFQHKQEPQLPPQPSTIQKDSQSQNLEERRQPSQYDVRRQLPYHEERKSLQHDDRRPLPHLEERRQLPQLEEKKSSQHQEKRQLPQYDHKQPPGYVDQRQPPQQEKESQPVHHMERQLSSQHEEHKQLIEHEQFSLKEKQQKQPIQSKHQPSQSQQFRQPSQQIQPEAKQPFQQKPEQQHQSYTPPPQHLITQSPHPHQQPRHQQQFNNQPYQRNSQHIQSLHQQGQPFMPEHIPPSLLQYQQTKPLSQTGLENNERDEQNHVLKAPAANLNVNSSAPGLPFKIEDLWKIRANFLANGVSSQVFQNSAYSQQQHHSIPHLQQSLYNYRGNIPPMSSLNSIPPPLLFPGNRLNFPAFSQRVPPPSYPPSMAYPPGFHPPHNLSSGYPHLNYENRGLPSVSGSHYSDHGGKSAGDQFMSPAVKNMFDNARAQVMNDNSDQPNRHK